ncbi:histidine phosphatase family protein [Pseudomonas sp. ADAK13]|uniref:histidine phosphatase family protein n=1 Tax=Pseudomonas sp. ADAK13 TaxID=2730847 RepID=UPI001464225F|nr:histidine phosphatase family protein [Pseudomonas sp. ADAK13]QJI37114.1 histidine phosphatase family protein [Pseudomonas sp. ADAK13]
MARLILIRHGQASFGEANYDALSHVGIQQAEHLGRVLRESGENIDGLWTGSLRRHLQTAQRLLMGADWEFLPQSLRGFDEFDHQEVIERYEPRYHNHQIMLDELGAANVPQDAFAKMFSAALKRWYEGNADDEYNETWTQFKRRVMATLERLFRITQSGETHIVITSGGVIAVITQALLGLSDTVAMQVNWTLANASITCVQNNSRGEHRLLSLNEHAHFRGEHIHMLTWR